MRGDRLKDLRETKNISQEELASMVGVGTQQIWRWESGKTKPDGDYVAKMAKALGTTSDYLLGLVDEPTRELTEEDLSPMERKLIAAVRAGLIVEALDTFNELAKPENKK